MYIYKYTKGHPCNTTIFAATTMPHMEKPSPTSDMIYSTYTDSTDKSKLMLVN